MGGYPALCRSEKEDELGLNSVSRLGQLLESTVGDNQRRLFLVHQ